MSRRATVRAPNPHLPSPVSAATRRDLFGTMGAMLLLSAAEAGSAKAAELDGELLACRAEALSLCAEADRITDAVDDLPLSDPRWKAAYDQASSLMPGYHAAVARAVKLPARTPEGLRAKADLVAAYLCNDANDSAIALSLACDVLGSGR